MSTVSFALPRDLRCSGCGYGIVARLRLPERCPMCGGSGWAAHSRLPSALVRVPAPAAPRLIREQTPVMDGSDITLYRTLLAPRQTAVAETATVGAS